MARAAKLSPERRAEIARAASIARWKSPSPLTQDEKALLEYDRIIARKLRIIQSTRIELNELRRKKTLLKKKMSYKNYQPTR